MVNPLLNKRVAFRFDAIVNGEDGVQVIEVDGVGFPVLGSI